MLDPETVYKELGEDSIIICYERYDKFCHRFIVAEWLEKELGIEISEVS